MRRAVAEGSSAALLVPLSTRERTLNEYTYRVALRPSTWSVSPPLQGLVYGAVGRALSAARSGAGRGANVPDHLRRTAPAGGLEPVDQSETAPRPLDLHVGVLNESLVGERPEGDDRVVILHRRVRQALAQKARLARVDLPELGRP